MSTVCRSSEEFIKVYESSVKTPNMRCSLMQEETGKDEAQQRVKWNDIERRYEEERGQQMMENIV